MIETVRVIGGRVPLWPLHLERLARSCQALEIALPQLVEPRGGHDRLIRFEVRTGAVTVSERGVGSLAPLALVTSPAPHRGYAHKLADRAWLEASRTSAIVAGADDALFFSPTGALIEASRWAIGWWEGEQLCFPSLALGGLPSVARARLGEVARGGIGVTELSRSELRTRSLVACNAGRGVVPVRVVDEMPVPENPRTLALQSRFWIRPSA